MEVGGQLHIPAVLTLGQKPASYWVGGWVGPRIWLGGVTKRKSCPVANRTPLVRAVTELCSSTHSTAVIRVVAPCWKQLGQQLFGLAHILNSEVVIVVYVTLRLTVVDS
jgi:hypothetical protein